MTTKPTINIKIDEVFKTNFSIFDDYEAEVKKQQVKLICYVESIAHALEKDIRGVNLFDILKNNNNIILANEAEINEALINFDRTKYFSNPEQTLDNLPLNETAIDKIKATSQTFFEKEKRVLERDINEGIKSAENILNRYHRTMSNVSSERAKLKRLVAGDMSQVIDSLNKITTDPRFQFLGFSRNRIVDDTIEFVYLPEIICTHKNQRADIDLRVNFGTFKFKLTFCDGIQVRIVPHKDNVMYDRRYHPHLSTDGVVCFGNMTELYNEALETQDFLQMFEVITQVLHNYNDDDAYVPLATFAEKSRQVQPNGQGLDNNSMDSRYQYQYCPECDCEHEIEFAMDSDFIEVDCPECDYIYEYEWGYDI